ncbi:hypothetical protein [Rhodococcus sp. OK302]|uniref:hypothetical protein n=1 Tax=Rhodococcus sp. OK302 TaxID=1882769 RepID=UPI000B944A20|nr:hypothetical protein [Rhodococcus sp. OK302]OYD69459.1 hypothetical protein BDB13_3026 [Rhodococcus sp. OK302]
MSAPQDDYRAAPARRAFKAGSMAGYGDVLWVLDVSHPLLLRRVGNGEVTEHVIPGPIRGSGIVGYKIRSLWADESGCWITGRDGIAHCDSTGVVRVLDEAPVRSAALVNGVLAYTTHRDGRDEGAPTLIRLRTIQGSVKEVTVPADVQSIGVEQSGFLVFMRTGVQGTSAALFDRGCWCARVSLDGTCTIGTAWPRRYWETMDVKLVDIGAPLAVSRSSMSAEVLDDNLFPALRIRLSSSFGPWPVVGGPWFAATGSHVASAYRDDRFDVVFNSRAESFAYYRLDRHLTRPAAWAFAPGFPKDLAVLASSGQLWISTTEDLYVSEPDSLRCGGEIELREADQQDLPMPYLPVNPPAEVGDPEVWACRERARLIEENRDLGLIDVEIEGWFPFTTVLVTFQLSELRGVVCARRFGLFNRDGQPALWRGAPTLLSSMHLDIMETGGIRRLRSQSPDAFGRVWV